MDITTNPYITRLSLVGRLLIFSCTNHRRFVILFFTYFFSEAVCIFKKYFHLGNNLSFLNFVAKNFEKNSIFSIQANMNIK